MAWRCLLSCIVDGRPLHTPTLRTNKKESCGTPSLLLLLLLLLLLPIVVGVVPGIVLVKLTIDGVDAIIVGSVSCPCSPMATSKESLATAAFN